MKKIVVLGLLISFLFFLAPFSYAVNNNTPVPSLSPTPATDINSFELFWPLVAGRTMADPFYQLKTLKEDIRGFFIFGKAQKADYLTFLVTKRSLEVEKLLTANNSDLALKTLDKATFQLASASSNWEEAKKNDTSFIQEQKDNIQKQLSNLDMFFNFLSLNNQGDIKSKLDETKNKVEDFQKSL